MVKIGKIFPGPDDVRKALVQSHGIGYSVVAVTTEKGVKIYGDPQQHNHPFGEDVLDSNLKGARIMYGQERALLVRADALNM